MEMKDRFRSFLPIVIDTETGGVVPYRHALLELCAVIPTWKNDQLVVEPENTHFWAVEPRPELEIDPRSLEINKIDPFRADRDAYSEDQSLKECFLAVRKAIRENGCKRAIATGHNTHFDLAVIQAAAARNRIKRDPFHPFSVIDTVSLAAVAFGHTVLREVCERAEIAFDSEQAHGARYDATITAQLFCRLVNASGYEGPRSS